MNSIDFDSINNLNAIPDNEEYSKYFFYFLIIFVTKFFFFSHSVFIKSARSGNNLCLGWSNSFIIESQRKLFSRIALFIEKQFLRFFSSF